LRLKNRKNDLLKGRGRAAPHGGKIFFFFKTGSIILLFFIFIVFFIFSVKLSASLFTIKHILISGNYYLTEDDVKKALIVNGESLLKLSFDELERRAGNVPWIRKASFRREFPNTLLMKVEEAIPKALLRINSHLFIIDSDGRVLEEIQDKDTYFLPVIVEVDPKKDKGGILEALKLIDALTEQNILPNKGAIEIMLTSYGIDMNIDGEFVKIGYGGYKEKIGKWKELEPEIRKKNIDIEYVDLRFKNKVIIKPVKTEKEKTENSKR